MLSDGIQSNFCVAELSIHVGVEHCDGTVVLVELTRNVEFAQPHKRRDPFGSRCLVIGLECLGCGIEAQCPINLLRDLVGLGQERDEKQFAQVFHSSGDGGTRKRCLAHVSVFHRSSRDGTKV